MEIVHGDASRGAQVPPTCHPGRHRVHMYGRHGSPNEHIVPGASRSDEHASDTMAHHTGCFDPPLLDKRLHSYRVCI